MAKRKKIKSQEQPITPVKIKYVKTEPDRKVYDFCHNCQKDVLLTGTRCTLCGHPVETD